MTADAPHSAELVATGRPALPFSIGKIGHVALYVSDIHRSARFYADILGFYTSDIYGEDMMPGGAVFMRCNPDHHGIALFKATEANPTSAGLHHLAFEVATLDEVVQAREHLRQHAVAVDFDGRRRAGVQIAVEFRDPDGHRLEIYWGIDQIAADGQARPPHEWKGASSLEAAIADPVVGQDTRLRNPALLRT
jgi:catechol 2,3-dioxygenase-like lactoylglutathione lyase family enzyme